MSIQDIITMHIFQFDGMLSYGLWLTAATLLFLQYLEKRERFHLRLALSYGILLLMSRYVVSILMNYGKAGMIGFPLLFVLDGFCVWFVCNVSIAEAFACAMYGMLTEHMGNALYILIFPSRATANLLYLLSGALVFLVIWFFVARKMTIDKHYSVTGDYVAFLCTLCVAITMFLSFLCKTTADPAIDMHFVDGPTRTLLQYSQVYDIAFCVTMLVTQLMHSRQMLMEKRLQNGRELMRMHEEQYRLTRENIDLINRKCHDMKHQVALLMAQSERSGDSIERYSEEINRMIDIYDTGIDTKNEVLNTVLKDKSLYCSMNGISWTCAAHGEDLGFMEPMDLVCLIGNALDNAVEAVERIEDAKKRIIQVQIARKGNFVHMVVENSFSGEIRWQDGKPATSKKNDGYHGFGVGNITAIAEKYNGSTQIETEDNIFVLSVLLPIPEK